MKVCRSIVVIVVRTTLDPSVTSFAATHHAGVQSSCAARLEAMGFN